MRRDRLGSEGRQRHLRPSRNKDIADDIREGTLVEEFGLLEALATEDRITAAVLRCLTTGRLRAHHESDPDDPSLCYVVLTAAPKPGDCFALDGCAYPDGDVMYVEVLEVVARFADYVDHTGAATGGYRVAVFCDQEPQRAEDYYGRDFLDGTCVRLSAADMALARAAGWPRTYVRFREVLGDELALTDWRGVPVGSLSELSATSSRQRGWSP